MGGKGSGNEWDTVLIVVVTGGDGINTQVEGGASVGRKAIVSLVMEGRGQDIQTLSTGTGS